MNFDCDIFEANEIFVEGNTLKETCNNIYFEFEELFKSVVSGVKVKNGSKKEINFSGDRERENSYQEDLQRVKEEKEIIKQKENEMLGIGTADSKRKGKRSVHQSFMEDLVKEDSRDFIESEMVEILYKLSVDDIYINSLEEDVDKIITENKDKILGKKKIFNLEKEVRREVKGDAEIESGLNRGESNRRPSSADHGKSIESSKNSISSSVMSKQKNHLRQEAGQLEKSLNNITTPTYQELKEKKFANCGLHSYKFYKKFGKKLISKENNYIFNFRDNFLNEMSKIDKDFFKTIYKNKSHLSECTMFDRIVLCDYYSTFRQKEIIYEFSIYHPTKNIKTLQVSAKGTCFLSELKDIIYCVLDEVQQGNSSAQGAFFFIENIFYIDDRFKDSLSLSKKIIENKMNKMNTTLVKAKQEEHETFVDLNYSKYDYDKGLYSRDIDGNFNIKNEVYEEKTMSNVRLNEISMRVGYPYLYRHLDSCDHMILLSDIRLTDGYDVADNENKQESEKIKTSVTYQRKLKRSMCDACNFYYARFISINDKFTGGETKVIFYCDECLKNLHKKSFEGEVIKNVKLIPYYHD